MLTNNQILHKGRYRIVHEFGPEGSTGLFEAYDTSNNSNVVLREYENGTGKILTSSQRDASEAIFVTSAKVLTKIRHGNVVAVKDYFSEVGNQYLVLENIAGFDLNRFLGSDESRPSVDQAVKWTLNLLDALEYLHKLSPPIVHGDIRPQNIRFSDVETAKLLAVGTQGLPMPADARAANETSDNRTEINYQPLEKYWANLDQLTQRSILRTYDDRSERLLLHKLDARSDLYSLAACMYHALAGFEPPAALDRASAINEGKEDPLQQLCDVDSSIPSEVSEVFMKALSIRREFRFYSAAVMSNVLKEATARSADREEENVLEDLGPAETQHLEAAGDGDDVEIQLELEMSQADERHRELEEEQIRLEQEQERIAQRRAALEAEKQLQLAEKTRIEQAAKLEQERKENERRLEEKKRIEAEVGRERETASLRLAEIEADLEQKRLEAERLEREAEEEQLRAAERLSKLREEKARLLTEQQKEADAVKQELQRAETRLQQIAHADVVTGPATSDDELPAIGEFATRDVEFTDAPNFTLNPTASSSKRLVLIGALTAVLVVFGGGFWLFSPSGTVETLPDKVTVPSTGSIEPASNINVPTEAQAALPTTSNSNESTSISTYQSTESTPPPAETQSLPAADQQSAQRSPEPNPAPGKKRIASAAKSPTTKKVTVDDLINDN